MLYYYEYINNSKTSSLDITLFSFLSLIRHKSIVEKYTIPKISEHKTK